MHKDMQVTGDAGSKWLFGILFLLIPCWLAFVWVSALSRNATPASAVWFLYEVSRLVGYVGILAAAGITVGAAIRRATSGLFLALMVLSIGSAALVLWYTAHIFRSPW
ncbi:MAG: hypothetical protein WB987_01140 [Candidatus Acidiferrales bacterium]